MKLRRKYLKSNQRWSTQLLQQQSRLSDSDEITSVEAQNDPISNLNASIASIEEFIPDNVDNIPLPLNYQVLTTQQPLLEQ